MMTKNQPNKREQLEMLPIDQLVPEDHLVRKIESAMDFLFSYPLVENLYSGLGRPSIDPVVLFRLFSLTLLLFSSLVMVYRTIIMKRIIFGYRKRARTHI